MPLVNTTPYRNTSFTLLNASFVKSLSVKPPLDDNPSGIVFKPDGTRMFVVSRGSDRRVYQFDLSIAWDISTASAGSPVQSFNVFSFDTTPWDIFFKPDGTKMFLVGNADDEVNEFNVSPAWDITGLTFVQNEDLSGQTTSPIGIVFKPDGTKMYISDGNNEVLEYDLSVAWDVSTISFLQSGNIATEDVGIRDMGFKDDGTKMFMLGGNTNNFFEYDLGTPWDISTLSYTGNSFSVAGQDTIPNSMFLRKDDGSQLFMTGSVSDSVHEYSLD